MTRQHSNQTVVLLVDDEVLVLNVCRFALEASGYFILTANDGEEALVVSRRYPGTIHALVSDIKMPNMDGMQLREKILVERPTIKVLLISGEVELSLEHIPFLRKPFDILTLQGAVRQLLATAAGMP
jgi:DNA-binding NtrC family response regulator